MGSVLNIETQERQKQKVSAKQNNIYINILLTVYNRTVTKSEATMDCTP